jgi:hypothetical protein
MSDKPEASNDADYQAFMLAGQVRIAYEQGRHDEKDSQDIQALLNGAYDETEQRQQRAEDERHALCRADYWLVRRAGPEPYPLPPL